MKKLLAALREAFAKGYVRHVSFFFPNTFHANKNPYWILKNFSREIKERDEELRSRMNGVYRV